MKRAILLVLFLLMAGCGGDDCYLEANWDLQGNKYYRDTCTGDIEYPPAEPAAETRT